MSTPPTSTPPVATNTNTNTTSNPPKRGKFLNVPVPKPGSGGTSPAPKRGKFLNIPTANKADITAKSSPIKQKRKRSSEKIKQQQKLFEDLDKAQDLVINIIDVAKKATECLAKMADSNPAHNTTSGDDAGAAQTTFDDVLPVLKKHGEEYLKSLGQVHALLAPHANKVVAYRDSRGRRKAKETKTDAARTNKVKAAAGGSSDEEKTKTSLKNGDNATGTVIENHGGMYAARVEMKLAIERKNLLKDMLDLYAAEEKGAAGHRVAASVETEKNGAAVALSDPSAGDKRKVDD
mmetsp:Transcript_27925/g.43366  ORF Transcript_27925/g.43366 Transcript_27925/m.43366 type:complete len:292 (+) Transcript_27925:1-876(+)